LGATLVPVVAMGLMAVSQTRRTAKALNEREMDALRHCARSAASALDHRIAQDEGDVLGFLDLESIASLAASMATAERVFPGVSLFLLLEDGTAPHPPEPGAGSAGTNAPAAGASRAPGPDPGSIRAALGDGMRLRERLGPDGVERIDLTAQAGGLALSLRALRAVGAAGVVAIGWHPERIAGWCREAAAECVPERYRLVVTDASGRDVCSRGTVRAAPQGAPLEVRLRGRHPLGPDGFPWAATVHPGDPAEIRELIRRQAVLYIAALLVVCTVSGLGIGSLVSLALREAQLARLKSDFAANVSHELRTPLALIRAAADALLLQSGSGRNAQRYLEIVRRESQRLAGLVSTVLRFAQDERGAVTYHRIEIDVCGLVREFVGDWRAHVEEQGFTMEVRVPAEPLFAALDREAVWLVLVNLLDNAVKFSAQEKRVGIDVERRGDSAAIRVRDRGIGIAPEHHERIFESFFRVEGNWVKKTRGTGIGLALVREIVRAHGGRVTVESREGEGAAFTVLFPLSGSGGAVSCAAGGTIAARPPTSAGG
jgi:signal transduction histidine kinase